VTGGCVAFPKIAVPEAPGAGKSAVDAAVVEVDAILGRPGSP
jgi:hypothetical protein